MYNEDEKEVNDEDKKTREEESQRRDNNFNNEEKNKWDDMNDMGMWDEGSINKRKNRNSSVDDKKYKNNNNVKCQCFIF